MSTAINQQEVFNRLPLTAEQRKILFERVTSAHEEQEKALARSAIPEFHGLPAQSDHPPADCSSSTPQTL